MKFENKESLMSQYDYYIRELRNEDYSNGFIDCLEELTVVGRVTSEMFAKRLMERNAMGVATIVAVDKATSKVLGTASMIYEPKFIHECAIKAYIEDVCVAPYAQKMGIGKSLILYLEEKAILDKCYKIVLTCNEENQAFYEKMNFKKVEVAMAIYTKQLH